MACTADDGREGRGDQRSTFFNDELGTLRKAQQRTVRGVHTWKRLPNGDTTLEFFAVDWGFSMLLHARDSPTIDGSGSVGSLLRSRFKLLARAAPCRAYRDSTPP